MNKNQIIPKSFYLFAFTIFHLNLLFAQSDLPLPAPCEFCGAKFTHKNKYDVQITHKPNCKYYPCPICGANNFTHRPTCSKYVKGSTTTPQSNTSNLDPLKTLNSVIDLLQTPTEQPKPEVGEEKKELSEKRAAEERLRKEKSDRLKQELKPIDNSKETEQKVVCIKAQKEVYRLLTLKIKFENQLFDLQKWNNDLDDLQKGFSDDKNDYTKGFSDDLLNAIPIEKIKGTLEGSKKALEGERLEKAINATKILKSSVENLLTQNGSTNDTVFSVMDLANKSYSYVGQVMESTSIFVGEKYKKTLEQGGRCLQLNSSSMSMAKNDSYENIGNSIVDGLGMFFPPARLTAAWGRITLKAGYEIFSDWQIHKLTTTKSENLKAQEFLTEKIKTLEKEISTNQNIVNEYTKTNPAGCPVY